MPPERQDNTPDRRFRVPGHEFSGVANRVALTVWRHMRQVIRVSLQRDGARVRGVSGCQAGAIAINHPTSHLRRPASVPVASQTGHGRELLHHCHLKGTTILIHGVAGAVGAYAVQLASRCGASGHARARRATMSVLTPSSQPGIDYQGAVRRRFVLR